MNLARGRAVVRFDPDHVTPDAIAGAMSDVGYPAKLQDTSTGDEHRLAAQSHHARLWLRRAIVGIALWLPVELLHWAGHLSGHMLNLDWLALITSTIAMLYVGRGFYASAWHALLRAHQQHGHAHRHGRVGRLLLQLDRVCRV